MITCQTVSGGLITMIHPYFDKLNDMLDPRNSPSVSVCSGSSHHDSYICCCFVCSDSSHSYICCCCYVYVIIFLFTTIISNCI